MNRGIQALSGLAQWAQNRTKSESEYRRELHEHVGECTVCQRGTPCSWARSVIEYLLKAKSDAEAR